MLVVRASGELRDEASAIADRVVELRAAAGVDTVRPPALRAAVGSDTVAAATLAADEAFAALAFADAGRGLDVAFALADDGQAATRDELVALWLLASMLHGALGDAASADEAARAALAIDPALVLDPARYPPTLGARIDALRPTLASCPVAITLDPADAVLSIDGSVTTRSLPDALACGPHWLTVSRPGYAASTQRVALAPSEVPSAIHVALVIDPAAALATPSAAGEPIPPMVELGASALGRTLTVLDLAREPGGTVRATLGLRGVRIGAASTPDEIARALLAPIERPDDSAIVIGVGIGVGAAVAAAIAIGLGVALAPSSPPGWIGVGEVLHP